MKIKFFERTFKPDDEGANAGEADGSLFDATRAMPDIEALEKGGQQAADDAAKAARERETNGRFKAKGEVEQQEPGKAADKVETGKAKADTGDEQHDDEDDYLELPPETEGEEPKRLKVSEVWAGYQKAQQLEAEIAASKGKLSAEMGEDAVQATENLIKQMAEYRKANEIFAALQQVREPNIELLNEASEHYNPALYGQQKLAAQKAAKAIADAKTEMERVAKDQETLQKQLDGARFQREQAKLKEFWPELMADKAVQTNVLSEAEKAYGLKAEDFSGIVDHRHYKVLKDALAYRADKAKTEAAVKIVRAKPKLVKGAARSVTNPKDAKRADAMDRLSKSGSIDDAADALEGFLH